jgi:multidrug efflux pump subunit AcrB
VGDITYLGQRDYSMRVWLDPEKMSFRNLTSSDVQRAIEQQNVQVAAGQLGQPPVPVGQAFQYSLTTKGRLVDAEEFGEMIIKTDTTGRIVRLRDVARIELGAQGYDQTCTLDGKPSVALSIYQRPGSNALATAERVRAKMEELKARFESGLDYAIVYDTTPFINESVHEVYKTLRDAVILVAFVVLLFLQKWRSALIPLVAVPVAIVGTFAVMAAIGFSLNNLTLFGLVLAIGIVVDDAIVVVEAVEHHIEHGMSPRDATIRAMNEVSGPVIAIGLVLAAVFVPCAFISGIIGQFFRQFALTIATSTLISAFNSLTLSPALAALLLRPQSEERADETLPRVFFVPIGAWLAWEFLAPWLTLRLGGMAHPDTLARAGAVVIGALAGWVLGRPLNRVLATSFRLFNVGFNRATNLYTRSVGMLLRVSALVLLVYGGLLYLTYQGFTHAPVGFIPAQDKGYLLVNVQLPDARSVQHTQRVMEQIEKRAIAIPGVRHTVAIAGQSLLLAANAPNYGSMYVMLDDFHKRLSPSMHGEAIAARLGALLQDEVTEGKVAVFGAPPVEGLGTVGGFKIVVEDRTDLGRKTLQDVSEAIAPPGGLATVDRKPLDPPLRNALANLDDRPFTGFRADTPWLDLKIDRAMVKTLGVNVSELFNTLQVYLGSLYVNDFNRFGRTWQVNVQGESHFRKQIDDLKQLKVRNEQGRMVPLMSVASVMERPGPVLILRYNMYPSAAINGMPAPGISSGQAIDAMEKWTQHNITEHAHGMRSEWTELALLQLQTGNTAMLAFVLAVVLVFLVLAAQYESWALPLAVILVVPMCLLCSVAGVLMARMDINIFTQVGFIVLVGLACKNAILIVEFAKAEREAGVPRFEATLEACQLRLRPIMMTSFAFILGVVPLVLAEGAGAEMRRTLGTAVFSGMLGVTLFGIFLTPVFYFVIQWFSDRRQERRAAAALLPDGQPAAGSGGGARRDGERRNGHPPSETREIEPQLQNPTPASR